MLGECSTVTKLIDQVVIIGGPKHLHEFDDVDVVYLGEDGDLVVGELAQLGSVLEFLDVHHLDCENLLVFSILGLVYVAVLALAYLLEKHVILNYLVHFTCILIAKIISISSHRADTLPKKSPKKLPKLHPSLSPHLKYFGSIN
jgi:hypothetical protein